MAISHIGRVLRQRVEQERQKTALNLLEGPVTSEFPLDYFRGYAQGLKWAMGELEEIEKEGS